MTVNAVILDSDPTRVTELRRAFEAFKTVTISTVDQVVYTRPIPGLDAVVLVLPAAERWGARPLPGEAQVLKTTVTDQSNGMPRYVIAGVALRPADPRGPLAETRLFVGSAFQAARQFNKTNPCDQIQRLGFWGDNLLKGVTPEQLASIFSEFSTEDSSGNALK